MDLELRNRTGIVTGASSGIGRASAVALATEGVRLVIVARRQDALEKLADELEAKGSPRPQVLVQDVTDSDAAERIAQNALKFLTNVDILVNNVGGHSPSGTYASAEQWDRAYTFNFTRNRELTTNLLEGMRNRKWGRIINISGKSEPMDVSGVGTSKAALHAWSKGLSREVGPDGITVNCIAPGRITSEQMIRDYTPETRAAHIRDIPVGDYGKPEDLANMVCFLASDRARYITGTVIPIDGGYRHYQF